MTPDTDPVLTGAARRVAETEEAAEIAAASLAAARQEQARVQARLDAAAAERAEIGTRRVRGDAHPEDAARVALLALDAEALGALLDRAKDATAAARGKQEAAARALAEARAACAETEAALACKVLVGHALELAGRTQDTLELHGAAAAGLGFADRRAVCAALATLAERLDGALLSVVRQIGAGGLSGPPIWGPSQELRGDLRRIMASLGTL